MASNQQGGSLVPDLMRVYESLTKGNANVCHEGSQQEQQQQHVEGSIIPQGGDHHQNYPQSYQPQQQQQQPIQSHHVNYALINSEEQYQQLYEPSSLPVIPPPLTQSNLQMQRQQQQQQQTIPVPDPPKAPPSVDDDSSRSSTRAQRRKRPSINSQAGDDHGSVSSTSKAKSRKKAKETDGRWSKRFTWPDELHRDFVSAVFDVGLKHSSPSTILEHMPKHPQITSERIKSHLQKFRYSAV